MRTLTILCMSFMATFAGLHVPAVAEDFRYPSQLTLEEVRDWIDRCDEEHPRLLATGAQLAQLRASLDKSPRRQATAKAIIHQADQLLDTPPITRTLQGRRLLGQSRKCVKRLLTLAMAFHLTGQPEYVERAEQEMLAVADFSDWNPSHFLDVAEMTFGMAIGYDWLFHSLPPSSRQKIRTAIIEKGVTLPFTTRHNGWVRARNNWGQVCHGGLTAGALAVLEDEPELAAKTVHNALQNVHHSMDAYAPNGSYPEGPGYWTYGTSYNVLLIAALKTALTTDFGLTQAPGFRLTGQYPALTYGPSGQFFNYADGGAGRGVGPTLFWFAQRFERPDWLLGEYDRLDATVSRIQRTDSASYGSRLFPLILLWMPSEPDSIDIQMPLHWKGEGHVPITLHRSSWKDPNATFVGFKGGSPSANHGQMDIGSIVLDADGKRWALDLGAEGYHGIESRGMNLWSSRQDSDRWKIFRQSNAGHNTLVIDGQLQRAAGHGTFVEFSDDPKFPYSLLDMSDVYQGQAESVRRGVALLPTGEVLIRDQLTGLEPGAVVRWGMITPGAIAQRDRGELQLQQDEAQLKLAILSSDSTSWQEVNTAQPRHEWDSPNRGTRMVAFEDTAPESGKLTFVVLATPGSCSNSVRPTWEPQSLDNWSQHSSSQ